MSDASNNDQALFVNPIELAELEQPDAEGKILFPKRFDLVKDVKVSLVTVIGEACMSIDEFFALRDGSVVTLDRAPGAMVDVELDGRVVARGELVVVDDVFGVQIREVA